MADKKLIEKKIKVFFDIGDLVYDIIDPKQKKGVVTRLIVTVNGIIYNVRFGDDEGEYYSIDLSDEPNMLLKVTDGQQTDGE